MKKTLVLAALVAVPAALAGPSPTSVSAAAQPPLVVYGSPTTLTGTVTPAQSAKATVSSMPCGTTSFKTLTTVESNDQGTWSALITPRTRTTYRVKIKGAVSPDVTVQVRPRVTLTKVGVRRYRTRVSAAQSLAGRIALFQRRTASGWRTVKSVRLLLLSSGETIVSGRTFRSGIRRGRTVRILLTQRQVGGCYLPGVSKLLRT